MTVLPFLVGCYLAACGITYRNTYDDWGRLAGVLGFLLMLVITVYATILINHPVDIATALLIYVAVSAPFYGALLLGMRRAIKNRFRADTPDSSKPKPV